MSWSWRQCGLLAAGTALALSLSACNYRAYHQKSSGYDYGSRSTDDPKVMQIKSYGANNSDPSQHDNRYFEYSNALSRQVSALPGIASAMVFLTDRNAYVGIMTDWSATGTRSRGSAPREQQNGGTMEGVYNVDNGRTAGPDASQFAQSHNSYFTHKDVSDISSKLKQTIADEIRRGHPRVAEVHISANREYVNQLVEFAKEAWAGKQLAPLTPEFNRLVQYIFGMGKAVPLPLHERPAIDSATVQ